MKKEFYNENKARENMLLVENVEQSYNHLQSLYSVIEKRDLTEIQAYNKIKGKSDTLLHKADVYGGYSHERYRGKKHDLALLLTESFFMDRIQRRR